MDGGASTDSQNVFPWELGVFDAHCHPTDTMSSVSEIGHMKTTALIIMATRAQDQELVAGVAKTMSLKATEPPYTQTAKIVPSFGWHPWFSHHLFDDLSTESKSRKPLEGEEKLKHYRNVLVPPPEHVASVSSLPNPLPLSQYLKDMKSRLADFPLALVGEVGLDRAFRLPQHWEPQEIDSRDSLLTPGGREGRPLSPHRVQMDHQKKVLIAQLRLAGHMQRAVSCHGVQAHGAVYNVIREAWKGKERISPSKKEKRLQQLTTTPGSAELSSESEPFPPRICLHSYSGPEDLVKQYLHPSVPVDIYFSFSILVNFSGPQSTRSENVIRIVPDNRILIESDMHVAGQGMDDHLEAIARKICQLKDWSLSDGIRRLADNWSDFTFGRQGSAIGL